MRPEIKRKQTATFIFSVCLYFGASLFYCRRNYWAANKPPPILFFLIRPANIFLLLFLFAFGRPPPLRFGRYYFSYAAVNLFCNGAFFYFRGRV